MLTTNPSSFFIGLMSGTSLDGVNGVLASLKNEGIDMLASAFVIFPPKLRSDLMGLQVSGDDEINREATAAQELARLYDSCVKQLLEISSIPKAQISAIGVHGQTIRHRPELGYTRQINNPALLAELTGIDVIADFRARDIAAQGQGAPLVPAFHYSLCAHPDETRVVVNLGGMANISVLPSDPRQNVIGFDTGPGNVLMDAWIMKHLGKTYDADGAWAAKGMIHQQLLETLLEEPYFLLKPPKSTGRDLFDLKWLTEKLQPFTNLSNADVQATLAELTALTVAYSIKNHAIKAKSIYVCGGGAANHHLMKRLHLALEENGVSALVGTTDMLGIAPDLMEALAFAWLAQRFTQRLPGNLPSVTGAIGERILGALYPA